MLNQKKLKHLERVNLRDFIRTIKKKKEKEKFLKTKFVKVNNLSVSTVSIQINAPEMHRDSIQYLENSYNGFSLAESDDDSESLANFNFPVQHSKVAFYESLLNRKPLNGFRRLNETRQNMSSKIALESNTIADLTESTYESFLNSPRRLKPENRQFSIKHFDNLSKKKKPKPKTFLAKQTTFEDDSIIEKKIAPKKVQDKLDESNKDDHSEEDNHSNRNYRVRFDEKFNSVSFRNQNSTSFPNLFSSVSASQKKNKDSDLRSRDFFNSILQPKISNMEKYNLNSNVNSLIKYSKLKLNILDKHKKDQPMCNSIDFKHGYDDLTINNSFDSYSSNYFNHSHHFVKPISQTSDFLLLPNVNESKSLNYFNYGLYQRRKNESLVFT